MKKLLLSLIAILSGSTPLLAQPTITQPPTNQVLAAGATLNLSVTASDSLAACQWFKDSRLLLGATNSILTVANTGVTNSGTYYVVVTNGSGMIISLPALVSVGNPSLLAWGRNNYGQLGNGTTNASPNPSPTIVASNVVTGAAGNLHSLFVTGDGMLWGMGSSVNGQLGNGATVKIISPNPAPVVVASNVVAVAAGYGHSLFVKTNGTLWAMGQDNWGQLGNGTTGYINPTPVSVASNVVAVAAGDYHSLFVKTDGTLWAMGENNYGQLGNGTTSNTNKPVSVASNVVAVAAGSGFSLFVKTDGTLWAMGNNYGGALGNPNYVNGSGLAISVASNVVAVAAGEYHSLFVKADGTLWAMGNNSSGQLGNTNFPYESDLPVSVASNVVAVTAGAMHSLFEKTNGTLWAMGDNYFGELGNGSTTEADTPINMPFLSSAANIFPADAAVHSLAIGILHPIILSFAASSTNRQQLTLQLTGTPNYPFVLQSATNLTPPVNGHSILTNPADVNGNWSFTISNLSLLPAGFYRAAGQ